MMANRDEAYAQTRAHLNIWAEHIWIHETTESALAILVIDADQPSRILNLIKTPEWLFEFESGFRQQGWVHPGVDAGKSIDKYLPELVFKWQAA